MLLLERLPPVVQPMLPKLLVTVRPVTMVAILLMMIVIVNVTVIIALITIVIASFLISLVVVTV